MMRWLLIGFVLAGVFGSFIPMIHEAFFVEEVEWDITMPISSDPAETFLPYKYVLIFTALVFLCGLFLILMYLKTRETVYLKAGILGPILYMITLFTGSTLLGNLGSVEQAFRDASWILSL
ncbi:hypothetical protein ACFLRC_01765 [Candidatus Altiarchaeota archaeon]